MVLRELGLDTVTEQVYRILLDEPQLEGGLLAERLGLSHGEVLDALDTLAELALLRMSRQNPDQRRPVSLERGIALLLRRQEEELEARRRALEHSRAAASAMASADRRRQPPAGVELLVDLDEIQSRMESLVQSANEQTCSIVPTMMPAEALTASRPLDAELAARGVVQKVLCHELARTNPAMMAYNRWMAENGGLIRCAPALPHRLFLVDRSTAVVPLDPAAPGAPAVLITAPGIVAALSHLFDRIWETAEPLLEAPQTNADSGLTSGERELVRLLATGLTDEAAAKRLGVSVRTVKRRMEDLMRRLDAGSRFEAGYKAGQRGWLRPGEYQDA